MNWVNTSENTALNNTLILLKTYSLKLPAFSGMKNTLSLAYYIISVDCGGCEF